MLGEVDTVVEGVRSLLSDTYTVGVIVDVRVLTMEAVIREDIDDEPESEALTVFVTLVDTLD